MMNVMAFFTITSKFYLKSLTQSDHLWHFLLCYQCHWPLDSWRKVDWEGWLPISVILFWRIILFKYSTRSYNFLIMVICVTSCNVLFKIISFTVERYFLYKSCLTIYLYDDDDYWGTCKLLWGWRTWKCSPLHWHIVMLGTSKQAV